MRLLPHDEKFFEMLANFARMANDASQLLLDGLSGKTEQTGVSKPIRALECHGDEVLRQIYRRLHKTFITPIDPEDIHELAAAIDHVLDQIDSAAYRFEAYALRGSAQTAVEIAVVVHECVAATLTAIEALERDGIENAKTLPDLCEDVIQRELAAQERVRNAVRDLFENERDPILLMKKKEIYELMESIARGCASVALLLDAVAVKNS